MLRDCDNIEFGRVAKMCVVVCFYEYVDFFLVIVRDHLTRSFIQIRTTTTVSDDSGDIIYGVFDLFFFYSFFIFQIVVAAKGGSRA